MNINLKLEKGDIMQEAPTPEQVRDHLNMVIQHTKGLSIDNLWIRLSTGQGFSGSSYIEMLREGNHQVIELCGTDLVPTDVEIIRFHKVMLSLVEDPTKKVYTSLRCVSSAMRHLVLWEYRKPSGK